MCSTGLPEFSITLDVTDDQQNVGNGVLYDLFAGRSIYISEFSSRICVTAKYYSVQYVCALSK